MCGILGIATASGQRPSVSRETVERMRDTMAHRGPDGAGLWQPAVAPHIVLAHRRLVVVDPTSGGAQPMATRDGRHAITYNGELYNDAELRRELEAEGARFQTASDTETVLEALVRGGPRALQRLRGMFALAFYDADARRLLLARDPLGIKPLYYTIASVPGHEELVFASEPRAILAHPHIAAQPDIVTVSAYLTTIRTVMGARTLFEGIRTLRPGQAIVFDLASDSILARPLPPPPPPRVPSRIDDPAAAVRAGVADSVRRHLRSDVPVCGLLSGGLDSSIITGIASTHIAGLHTYCSGAPDGEDFKFAREMAAALGTPHTEAPVTRELFAERWPEMVRAMGVPLSTPNEVAINHIARTLRADGRIVALSGEGADELFGGYEAPIRDAALFEGLIQGEGKRGEPGSIAALRADGVHPGEFQLLANAWIAPGAKAAMLNEPIRRGTESDHALVEFYRQEFDACREPRDGPDRLRRHLRFHRRINLAGLLQRLDTATMLAGVEGRTPLADATVAALTESLPTNELLSLAADGAIGTKLVLRRAFARNLPPAIAARSKASFPLPFQEWLADHAGELRRSALARELFTDAAIETVATHPCRLWPVAWPMINIALWGRTWWP